MRISLYHIIPTESAEGGQCEIGKIVEAIKRYPAKIEKDKILSPGVYSIKKNDNMLEFYLIYKRKVGTYRRISVQDGTLKVESAPIEDYYYSKVVFEKLLDLQDVLLYLYGQDRILEDSLKGYLLDVGYTLQKVTFSHETMEYIFNQYKTIRYKLANIHKPGDSAKELTLAANEVEGVYNSQVTDQYYDKGRLDWITILYPYDNVYYRIKIKRNGEFVTREEKLESVLIDLAKEVYRTNLRIDGGLDNAI